MQILIKNEHSVSSKGAGHETVLALVNLKLLLLALAINIDVESYHCSRNTRPN